MQQRLQDVALPLFIAAADSCPMEHDATYGFDLRDEHDGGSYRDSTSGRAGNKTIVTYVHPQLGAASAGLALGDRVVEVNAKNVEEGSAGEVMGLVRRLTAAKIQPLQLVVERGAQRHTVTMWSVPACQFSLGLVNSEGINGVSNGRQVAVTTGAIRTFFWNDELAWIVAHEIAHNILSHVQNAKLRIMLNTFLNATIATPLRETQAPDPRSLEAQADYVGSYLMARAGYDLNAILRVWDRLRDIETEQNALGHEMAQTHPTTTERLSAFEETRKEIENLRQRGESLRLRLESSP
ncbi:MAG: M48 family metalloprotease [Nitrospira sp.]